MQISFYGGNFLGLETATVHRLLDGAARWVAAGRVDGIRFSTRPDTVDETTLAVLGGYPVDTVEIGVQSTNDRVLALAERGHTAADTARAVKRLRSRGYRIGLQMMVGLPGEDAVCALATGRDVAGLAPDFVRIYPTLVLRHSRLAEWYANGRYAPMTLDRCVSLVKRLFLLFREHRIPVVRMGLQATEGLADGRSIVAGPFHPAFGHLVHSAVFMDRATALLENAGRLPARVTLRVHPRAPPGCAVSTTPTSKTSSGSSVSRASRSFRTRPFPRTNCAPGKVPQVSPWPAAPWANVAPIFSFQNFSAPG